VSRTGSATLRTAALAALLLGSNACSRATQFGMDAAPIPVAASSGPSSELDAADVAGRAHDLFEQAERHVASELTPRNLNHASLWAVLGPLTESSEHLRRHEVGRSVQGRQLYAVEFGHGPTRVLLWSQMHGNEPTATLALVDLLRYLHESADSREGRQLANRLTIVMVPMLNPDGAQRNRRENAQGIDVNRDARRLASPEARALAAIHARFSPHFGFNLHDQSAREDEEGRLIAISLLAPHHQPQQADLPVRVRAKRVAGLMRMAAHTLVDGRVSRYEEEYNDQAFGDAMQSWGTSTVLLETGSWNNDPQKVYLRRVNFVLLLAALDAIATESYERVNLQEYDSLPRSRLPGHR
jgi:hypothetical protein